MAGKNSREYQALNKFTADLPGAIAAICGVTWFSSHLVQSEFIKDQSILTKTGVTDAAKANEMMDAVMVIIQFAPHPATEFEKFMAILQSEPALGSFVAQIMKVYGKFHVASTSGAQFLYIRNE